MAVAFGRYLLGDEIASGGMATVHVGRLLGDGDFSRTVAIKRLRPEFARDPKLRTMLADEARAASRVRHPNVVSIDDVVTTDDELYLVMEYVPGESLDTLERAAIARGERIPPQIVSAAMCGVLLGLDAAHRSTWKNGQPLDLIHRDVSPQNLLVGVDGVARVLDFGIARGRHRGKTATEDAIKGKLRYIAPEAFEGRALTQKSDIYAAGVVLWEALVGKPAFDDAAGERLIEKITLGHLPAPSRLVPELPAEVDRVVARAIDVNPNGRFATAREMRAALEECLRPASPAYVGAWLSEMCEAHLERRAASVARLEGARLERPAVPAVRQRTARARVLFAAGAFAIVSVAMAFAARPVPSAPSRPDSITRASHPIRQLVRASEVALRDSAPLASAPVRTRAKRPSAPRATDDGDCATVYTLDSDMNRVYKRTCLRQARTGGQ